MPILEHSAHKRDAHEALVRAVVDFAREVRIHLRNEQVIFGSIPSVAHRDTSSFRIRPWGLAQCVDIRFSEVAVAATVKHMVWTQHRAIAAAQQAGVFMNARKVDK